MDIVRYLRRPSGWTNFYQGLFEMQCRFRNHTAQLCLPDLPSPWFNAIANVKYDGALWRERRYSTNAP